MGQVYNLRLTGNIYRMEQVYNWRLTGNIYRRLIIIIIGCSRYIIGGFLAISLYDGANS